MGRRARRSEPQLLPAGMTASQLFPSLASLTLSASSKARDGALGTIRSGAQIITPPSTEVSAGAKRSTEQLTDPSSSNPNIHPGGWYCECPHFTGKETEVQRGQGACPGSHSKAVVGWAFKPRPAGLRNP